MKKKDELSYFKQEWSALHSHLRAFDKKGRQEDLHRFRVGVKKLRAFLALADSAVPGCRLEKKFRLVRKIFKAAGRIRDTYLTLAIVKSTGGFPDLLQEKRSSLKKSVSDFCVAKTRHLRLLRRTKRQLKKAIPKINDAQIGRYYQQQAVQLAGCLAQAYSDAAWHTCRRQLKMLNYNYQMTGPVGGITFNEAYLESLQAALGDLHDLQVNTHLLSNMDTELRAMLRLLKRDQAYLKKQVSLLAKDFYRKVMIGPDAAPLLS